MNMMVEDSSMLRSTLISLRLPYWGNIGHRRGWCALPYWPWLGHRVKGLCGWGWHVHPAWIGVQDQESKVARGLNWLRRRFGGGNYNVYSGPIQKNIKFFVLYFLSSYLQTPSFAQERNTRNISNSFFKILYW